MEYRISSLDKPLAIHILEKDVGKTPFAVIHPMNKTVQVINSALALVMLACLTSEAMAGKLITQAKVNQITPGLTTEEDLERSDCSIQTGKDIRPATCGFISRASQPVFRYPVTFLVR